MSINLRVLLMCIGFLLTVFILMLVSKNKLPIKYSLFWLVCTLTIFLVGAVPGFIAIFTRLAGFETTASLVIGIIVGMLLIITLLLTIIISDQKRRITLLMQEVSLLKQDIKK